MIGVAILGHRRAAVLLALLLAAAVAVPVVAYVVVPLFVRSTLVEALPSATAAAPATSGVTASSGTTPAAQPTPVTLAKGDLVRVSAVDFGSGVVRVVQVGSDRFLRFEDVEIAGAPDMYVYLSDRADGKPGTFVDLGKLKATNGSFNYPIPASVDLGGIRSVVVWCRQFTVTVTYALLARS